MGTFRIICTFVFHWLRLHCKFNVDKKESNLAISHFSPLITLLWIHGCIIVYHVIQSGYKGKTNCCHGKSICALFNSVCDHFTVKVTNVVCLIKWSIFRSTELNNLNMMSLLKWNTLKSFRNCVLTMRRGKKRLNIKPRKINVIKWFQFCLLQFEEGNL